MAGRLRTWRSTLARIAVLGLACLFVASVLVAWTPDTATAGTTLRGLIAKGDRAAIAKWASARTWTRINKEVASLSFLQRKRLVNVILSTNAKGEQRDALRTAMRRVLKHPKMGFYAEVWAYTRIKMSPGGFRATCDWVWLDPEAFARLSPNGVRDVLMHESLHSFNCRNNGPVGALNEGSAIWVYQAAFLGASSFDYVPSFAEATYGTKLLYRDIWAQPDYPMGRVGWRATAKLRALYKWLSRRDPSGLPWNSGAKLRNCFTIHFADLDRNVDFQTVWVPAANNAIMSMVQDPACEYP